MIQTSPDGPRSTRSTRPANAGSPPSAFTPKRFSTASTRYAPGSLARARASAAPACTEGERRTVHGPSKRDRPSPLALHSERTPATRCHDISRSPRSGKTPSRQPLRAASLGLTGPGPDSAAHGYRERERSCAAPRREGVGRPPLAGDPVDLLPIDVGKEGILLDLGGHRLLVDGEEQDPVGRRPAQGEDVPRDHRPRNAHPPPLAHETPP